MAGQLAVGEQPVERAFQIATQLALLSQADLISAILATDDQLSTEARGVARIGLANYFAGAFLLPYREFHRAAAELHYDIDLLGRRFGVGDGALWHPEVWPKLVNPFKPSWGEPYVEIAARMRASVARARELARGHTAVCVSHQLPIWTARRNFEGKRMWHDPRQRQCGLASLTTLVFDGDELVELRYREPAGASNPKVTGA